MVAVGPTLISEYLSDGCQCALQFTSVHSVRALLPLSIPSQSKSNFFALYLSFRQALVQAGLKRAEIGEISSKIGQLNFTFYQRCADTKCVPAFRSAALA